MRSLCCLLLCLFTAGFSSAQRYKTFESDFFEIGDSIRVEIEVVAGPYYRGWNIQGADKDRFVRFIEKNPRLAIGINVYSDTRGTEKKNLETTQIEAETYVQWLTTDAGFDTSRFIAKGWGEHKPVIPESKFEQYRGTEREKWDSIHALNKRVILVIEDVEQKMDCAYRTTDLKDLELYYTIEEPEMLNINDRFRLDFVQFEPNTANLINVEKEREKYASLAAFILCHSGVKFQLSAHTQSKSSQGTKLTQERANALIKVLGSTFSVPATRITGKGFDNARPIIPSMIIDELKDEPQKQAALRQLNDRIELEIIGIGAFNDAISSNQLRIQDPSTTREVLYRGNSHELLIQAYFDYDSLQPIASNNELSWRCTKTASKQWQLKLTVNKSAADVVHLGFLGWSKGKSKFIYTHAYEVRDLGEPSVYIGDLNISNADLSVLKDDDLFTNPVFTVKYDTAVYHLKKTFTVEKILIQVGQRKHIVDGGQLSKRVMKSIKTEKMETNIWFAGVVYEGKELIIGNGYDKKSRPRRSNFYPDYIGRKRKE
jgi:outer membrane protein OmpA-like peptidoglycan-associated protein